jgi:Zinc-binding dehydrogenase
VRLPRAAQDQVEAELERAHVPMRAVAHVLLCVLAQVGNPSSTGMKPVVEQRCNLADLADALRYIGEGHVRGKVVVTL